MFNKSKKGFTLVELLVVIAILAILTTVSIVGYTTFIVKAQLSNDQAFITQANLTLQAAAIPNPFQSASQAINELNRNGFAGKYNTYSSGFHYAYSLENNKMYLIDDHNAIIFPEEQVELSTLWGLYNDNSASYVHGITKYIAMTNIVSAPHFDSAFGSGSFEIDLNGHFINIDGTHAGVVASNGIVLGGVTAGEGANNDYTLIDYEINNGNYVAFLNSHATLENGTYVISDKIFTQFVHPSTVDKLKFENCIFYDNGHVIVGDSTSGGGSELILENCKFIDTLASDWCITLYRTESLKLKDCTFTGMNERGVVNAASFIDMVSIEIDGCTFDGIAGDYAGFVRFTDNGGKIGSVTFKNSTVTALNKARYILGFNGDMTSFQTTTWTFENNKVVEDISDGQYVFGNATLDAQFKASI